MGVGVPVQEAEASSTWPLPGVPEKEGVAQAAACVTAAVAVEAAATEPAVLEAVTWMRKYLPASAAATM